MANWLLTTGSDPDIIPGSTLLFRGVGHVTSDDEAAAASGISHRVSWSFKVQTIVAANPYHSEVIAFSNGTRHLQKIRNYIGCGYELYPSPVFEDNTAVIRYVHDIRLVRMPRTLAQHFHFRSTSRGLACGLWLLARYSACDPRRPTRQKFPQ
jgi:hypothetical protein